jgi:hypothetical protein
MVPIAHLEGIYFVPFQIMIAYLFEVSEELWLFINQGVNMTT